MNGDTILTWLLFSAFGSALFVMIIKHTVPIRTLLRDEQLSDYFTELSGHVFYCDFAVEFPHDWPTKRHEVPVLVFSKNKAWVYGHQWRFEEAFEAAGISRSLMFAFFPYISSFSHNEVELATGQIIFASELAQLCKQLRSVAKSQSNYERLVGAWCLSTHTGIQPGRTAYQGHNV